MSILIFIETVDNAINKGGFEFAILPERKQQTYLAQNAMHWLLVNVPTSKIYNIMDCQKSINVLIPI